MEWLELTSIYATMFYLICQTLKNQQLRLHKYQGTMPQITLYIDTLPEPDPKEDLLSKLWLAYTEAIYREDYVAAREYKREMDELK